MEEKNMTALVCCFARAYHNKNSNIKIYEDNLAEKILSKEEYDNISINMSNSIITELFFSNWVSNVYNIANH